jgi:hypothetical protein
MGNLSKGVWRIPDLKLGISEGRGMRYNWGFLGRVAESGLRHSTRNRALG